MRSAVSVALAETRLKMDSFNPSLLEMTPTEQLLATYYGQHFTVDIGKTIYWDPWGFDYEYMRQQYEKGEKIFDRTYIPLFLTKNPSFIDVIIRADDMIIGYCVIEIQLLEGENFEVQEFAFKLLTMVSFPKIEGRWQNVTEEYVWKEINRIHAESEN